jgi:hypothetical protein
MTEDGATTNRQSSRHEVVFALVLAVTAVATAWSGFQSAKWGGVQANAYALAGANRVESTRFASEADDLRTIDVIVFTDWIIALNAEVLADPGAHPNGAYEPREGTGSGFLHSRFRDEFVPAFDAWIELAPLVDPDAPSSPFAMPEYQLADQVEADRLLVAAEAGSAEARTANQRSDNYVLVSVMLALVLFFAAMGGRARHTASRRIFLVSSLVTLGGALITLATFPIEV